MPTSLLPKGYYLWLIQDNTMVFYLERVEVLHGLNSDGFRLCCYRNVTIEACVSESQLTEHTNDVVTLSANQVEFAEAITIPFKILLI